MYEEMAGCNPFFTLPRNTHHFPFKDLVKLKLFQGKFGMASILLKDNHVLKPVPTTGTHSCPTWEYPPELRSGDLRRASLPCGFLHWPPVRTQRLDKNCAFWRGTTVLSLENREVSTIWMKLTMAVHMSCVVPLSFCGACDETSFAFPLCGVGPEAKSLVGSHKSRLGLAHCWGWLRFAVEPQPNSPSAVRRRSVYSPEPWPTSGFTAGLHARDIIPYPLLLYHPSTPSAFGSCLFSFHVFL